MENEKSYYSVHDYDTLDPGAELKIQHGVRFNRDAADLSPYINKSAEELQSMRENSSKREHEIFEKLCAAVKEWEVQAAATMLLDKAIEFVKMPEIKHTANQWQKNEYGSRDEISNMVYSMSCSIYEKTRYNHELKEMVPVSWEVTWGVCVRNPIPGHYGRQIAGQQNKKYADKAAAEKYLQGRIKAYAHLFTEISPPVPKAYADQFKVNGQLLPGYTIEGQGQQYDKTAVKVSESLVGGVFTSANYKTSILEKLSCTKYQEKTQLKTKDVNKQKKEDLQR